jgi:hypothetical protein
MKKECKHEWHNTGLAFCTIPQSKMQICSLCGEERLHQEELASGTQSNLKCDICQNSMTKTIGDEGVIFRCENSECHQTWIFSKDGDDEIRASCTVMKHLWPSGMKENSKMFREEYLPEWLRGKEFYANALVEAELWSTAKRDEFISDCQAELSKWHDKHPLPEKPWWKFWAAA